jgi:hypothetical protein
MSTMSSIPLPPRTLELLGQVCFSLLGFEPLVVNRLDMILTGDNK